MDALETQDAGSKPGEDRNEVTTAKEFVNVNIQPVQLMPCHVYVH